MSNPILETFHSLHLMYIIADAHREENDLNVFFDTLATVDPLERRWMTGFASAAVGAEPVSDLSTDEEESDAELRNFKVRCAEMVHSGIADFFLAYGIVTYICNLLRMQSDLPISRRRTSSGFRGPLNSSSSAWSRGKWNKLLLRRIAAWPKRQSITASQTLTFLAIATICFAIQSFARCCQSCPKWTHNSPLHTEPRAARFLR